MFKLLETHDHVGSNPHVSLKFSRDDVISQLQLHGALLCGATKTGTEGKGSCQHSSQNAHMTCSTDGVSSIVGSDFKKVYATVILFPILEWLLILLMQQKI